MPKAVNEKFSFRQRGYVCSVCGEVNMLFGNDPDPSVCSNCQAQNSLKKDWDHMVESTVVVTPTPQS